MKGLRVRWLAFAMTTLAAALASYGSPAVAASGQLLLFTQDEIDRILQHGPWPPARTRDASNRVSGRSAAVALGAQLFFNPRLSVNGNIACSTCHDPSAGWIDRRARAIGIAQTPRNTISVVNSVFNRWFGWSGASDSLWAASLRPLLDRAEMGNAERHVAAVMRETSNLSCGYRAVFGHAPEADDEQVFVNVGKALAAFQETLVSGRTPFDDFRDALARKDSAKAARYPAAAQRGLRIFIGKGGCHLCHVGPHFSNHEFDKVGIPVRDEAGQYDWGRYDGIKTMLASRFNLRSQHNDDSVRATSTSTRHVALATEAYGAFKVPGLRNVSLTAPYMHNGALASLRDVVRHYSVIDAVKLHIAVPHPHAELGEELPLRPTESVLHTLNLSEHEISDLVVFLESLTERTPSRYESFKNNTICR